MSKETFVGKLLRDAAQTYDERNAIYGDNYKKFGSWVRPLMSGVRIETESDFTRIGILVQMFSKISRYVENFNGVGHRDSLLDLSVYSAMLAEIDNMLQSEPEMPKMHAVKIHINEMHPTDRKKLFEGLTSPAKEQK